MGKLFKKLKEGLEEAIVHEKKSNLIDYDDYLTTKLSQDPELVGKYIEACFEDEDPKVFMLGMTHIMTARLKRDPSVLL
jgi:hypothetical protein